MKILNFGSCNIDYVYSLDHIVNVGETLSSQNLSVYPGGKGLNQSVALSRAGVPVYHAGCVGSDGSILTELLMQNGVDISHIKKVDATNGHAIIQVGRDGENSIFIHSGSNGMISKSQIDSTLAQFEKGDILLLQNEINNIEYIVDTAFKKQMRIILNPSPINENLFNIDFNKLSYIVLNEVEAKTFSGCDEPEMSLEFFKKTFPNLCVMLTLGKNGCVYQDKNIKHYHSIFETSVVDSTAAGDTFLGYFVAGISQRKDIPEILKYASAASAIAVSRAGAAPSIPTAQQVRYALKTMKVKAVDMAAKRILKSIDDYIDNNICTVTLTELAKELDYSPVYTGSLIKKLTGKSYVDYLQSKRLELATHLLKNSEMPVKDIIQCCGYQNESYFRKIFKQQYNKTPLQYRRI